MFVGQKIEFHSVRKPTFDTMFRQNFNKTYTMILPSERLEIIRKINSGEIVSETIRGRREKWWMEKHHPKNEIPKNIYLLGKGTIQELHTEYIKIMATLRGKILLTTQER
jgi:hypothetical protein